MMNQYEVQRMAQQLHMCGYHGNEFGRFMAEHPNIGAFDAQRVMDEVCILERARHPTGEWPCSAFDSDIIIW